MGRGGRGGRGGYQSKGKYGSDSYGGGSGGYGRGRGGYSSYGSPPVHLSDFVNKDNQMRSLKLRGLPYSATQEQIRAFFGDYALDEKDIVIDHTDGRPTGYALV